MDIPVTQCRNCQEQLTKEMHYCQFCGQKTDAHKLGVLDLLYNFWNSVTNLDGSAINTLKYVWKPWALTRYYVAGRRKSFLNPIRVLLITMALYFGMVVSSVDFDSIKVSDRLFEKYTAGKLHKSYTIIFDSLPIECQNHAMHIDSTIFADSASMELDTAINFVFNSYNYRVATNDIMELSIDSIYRKYNFTSFEQKLISKQLIKATKNSSRAFQDIFGYTVWGTLFTIFAISLVYKIMYIRQKRYYVEHLVLHMNIHSLVFLMGIILSFVMPSHFLFKDDELQESYLFQFGIMINILVFVSMLFYYKQGILKTTVKYFIGLYSYIILFSFSVIFSMLIGFFLF
ncbi:MAG: DUF3667 domain-containing protein [Saprospiraceae bacterium]